MFKKIHIIFITLLCTLFACYADVSDKQVLEATKEIEKIIPDGMKKMQIPGVAIAVSRGNKVLYAKTFGKTTIDSNSPESINSDTLFPVSSVTKNITGFLVGALVDDGKIKWDDKVRKYDKDFFLQSEELSNELTILDLVSHSSGFKHFAADSLFSAGYEVSKVVDAFKYLKQKPGEFRKLYGYQNVVFGLIGNIIEKATGEKYEDLVDKYIFKKMNMNNSSAISLEYETSRVGYFKYLLSRFGYDKEKLGFFKTSLNLISSLFTKSPKNIVTSHSRYKNEINPLPQVGFFHRFAATSGISFSANDFGKWVQMLANKGNYEGKTIVKPETFEKITSKVVDIKGIKDDDYTFVKSRYSKENLEYAVGTFSGKYGDNGKNERKIIFHMGGIYGAAAFFAVSPEDDLGVAVVCNLGGVSHTLFAEYMVNQFLDLCFGFSKIDWAQADLDRKEAIEKKQNEFHDDLANKNPAPHEEIEKYAGTYTSDIYGEIIISEKNEKLTLSNGVRKTELQHVNGNIFKFPCKDILFSYFDEDEYVSFFKDKQGAIDSFYISCFEEGKTTFKKK